MQKQTYIFTQRDPRNKYTCSHRGEIPEKHKTGNHDIYMQKTNKKKKEKRIKIMPNKALWDKECPKMPLIFFFLNWLSAAGHGGLSLRVIYFPSETPLEKNNSFTSSSFWTKNDMSTPLSKLGPVHAATVSGFICISILLSCFPGVLHPHCVVGGRSFISLLPRPKIDTQKLY